MLKGITKVKIHRHQVSTLDTLTVKFYFFLNHLHLESLIKSPSTADEFLQVYKNDVHAKYMLLCIFPPSVLTVPKEPVYKSSK